MPAMSKAYSTALAPRSDLDELVSEIEVPTGASPSTAPVSIDSGVAVPVMARVAARDPSHVSAKASLTIGPSANTATTISAAMPAISRPYSTADAPRSSILARWASIMMRRYLIIVCFSS